MGSKTEEIMAPTMERINKGEEFFLVSGVIFLMRIKLAASTCDEPEMSVGVRLG